MDMGAFFRDYGTQIALVFAAANTIISLAISQLFKDSPRARIILVGASVALIGIGIGASFYSQHQIVSYAKAEKARHTMIREGIGRCIGTGQVIMQEFGSNKMPIPIPEEVDWTSKVDQFLYTSLGPSYVIRFHDTSGLGSYAITDPSVHPDGEHNLEFGNMYLKLIRLEEFSREALGF
jgi:hypothetical protein